jgi:hypothetical protein
MGENIDIIKKNKEALLNACNVCLEVNQEQNKCIQKIEKKHSIKIANRPFEDVAKFKYLGIIQKHQNCLHKESKSRINGGNTCYHLVQSLCLPACCLET